MTVSRSFEVLDLAYHSFRQLAVLILISPVAILVAPSAMAEWPNTPAAFAVLPKYCWARMEADKSSPERQMWAQRLGQGFLHVHHYCSALHEMNLANRARNPKEKKRLLSHAIEQIEYVEQRAPADFVLRPEMTSKKQVVRMRLRAIPSR